MIFRNHKNKMKDYILITGCDYYNRGSQAMLFNTVDELTERFPDKKIVMLSSMDYKKDNSNFTFEVLPDYRARLVPFPLSAMRGIVKAIKHGTTNPDEAEYVPKLDSILRNTFMIIDASGYALSSQWKPQWRNYVYLMGIATAEKYHIPTYLMQQSFGPFDFNGIGGSLLNYFIKKYLRYPRAVFARENEGYQILTNIRKNNTYRMNDIVLLNKELRLNSVFKQIPAFNYLTIKHDRPLVAIVPNMTSIMQAKDKSSIIDVYKTIIDYLIKKYDVYLIKHSNDDEEVIQMIGQPYSNVSCVHVLTNDVNCIEFEYLISQFEFNIASRFHSIVHSYKNDVPWVVLGWATKYKDLLNSVSQGDYLFDVRQDIDKNKVLTVIKNMENNLQNEKKTISQKLLEIQQSNSFDIVEDDVKHFYEDK